MSSKRSTQDPAQGKIERPYPRRTLEEALRIPRVIKEKNAGNEWDTKEVAAALGVGAATGPFFYLTAASRDFGLTEGTRYTATSKLTDVGRRVVYPASSDEERQAIRDAFLRIDAFRGVLEYYRGASLPEERFLGNVLQQSFGLDPSTHKEFVDLFQKNCRFVGIGDDYEGSDGVAPGQRQATTSVTVATPKNASAEITCFVAMPFTERDERHSTGFFSEVLENLFKPALTAAGFRVRTALQQGSDLIHHTIVNELLDADLVLVDLTEHNPNVLFELGMRMAADRPIVLVRAKGTGPIFDVDNTLRVLEYSPTLWKSAVEKDVPRLTEHIVGAWENRETNPTYMEILRRAR